MLRIGLCLLGTTTARRRGGAAASVVATAMRANSSSAGAEPPKDTAAAPPPSPKDGDTKAEEPATEEQRRPFSPQEVLSAVKSGDVNRIQDTATKLVQSQWKEEYTLPVACVVVFIILWYWVAWTRRSVRRKCEAMEAAVRQEAQETVDMVRNLTQKWTKDLAKSDVQMKAIIEKNSTLTADIDRMTTALRSCSIRPTPNLSTSAARVKAAEPVKAPETAESPGPAEPAVVSPELPSAPAGAETDAPAPSPSLEEEAKPDE